jgi:hypothetical protein
VGCAFFSTTTAFARHDAGLLRHADGLLGMLTICCGVLTVVMIALAVAVATAKPRDDRAAGGRPAALGPGDDAEDWSVPHGPGKGVIPDEYAAFLISEEKAPLSAKRPVRTAWITLA